MATLGEAVLFLTADDTKLGQKLNSAKQSATSWATGVGSTVATLAGGAVVAGVGAAATAFVGLGVAGFSASMEIDQAQRELQGTLGLTASEAEQLGDLGVEVFKNNFAGSISEATAAIGEARKQLGDLSDQELVDATENAFRLQDAFGVDLAEGINHASTLMEEFGLTQQEAFDFMASGFQEGLNSSDDFLDSIGEYSVQFAAAGFSADEFYSIMQSGAAGGVLGTDKINDAIKEMLIRLNEGGDDTKQTFDQIGLSYDDIAARVSSGEAEWADYFDQIVGGLNAIDSPTERAIAQTAIFGTMAEDLGVNFTEGLTAGQASLEDMEGAIDKVDARYQNFGSMATGLWRRVTIAITPLTDKLLDMANSVMPHVEQAFSWLESALPGVIDQLSDIFHNFFQVIATAPDEGGVLLDYLQELPLFLQPIAAALGNLAIFINEVAIPALIEFGSWFINEGWPAIVAFATPIIQQLIPGLQLLGEIALNIATAVWPFLVQGFQFLTEHMNIILPILAAVGIAILAISSPVTFVAGLIVLLATAWANNWGNIQGITQAAIDFITPYITAGINAISQIVTSVLAYLNGWWQSHGDSLMTIVNFVWSFIQSYIDTQIKSTQAVITTVATLIQAFWQRWGDTILNIAKRAWDNIQTTVRAAMDILGFVIDAGAALIEGDWDAFGEAIQNIWQTSWDAIETIITNAKDTLVEVATNIASDIKKEFEDIVDDLKKIGKDMMDGLWDGMKQVWDDIVSWVNEAANAIIEKWNDVLDFGSPSKVMIQRGKWIMEGLAVGMEESASLPLDAIQNTAQSIVNNSFVQNNYSPSTSAQRDFDLMALELGFR